MWSFSLKLETHTQHRTVVGKHWQKVEKFRACPEYLHRQLTFSEHSTPGAQTTRLDIELAREHHCNKGANEGR